MQDRFTAGLTQSTLKVYVVAISAYHILLGGMSMGKYPLVSRVLRGTLRLSFFPGSLRAFRGSAGQVFDLKIIVPPCYRIS